MSTADESAAGVDRQFSAELDNALFHRFPGFSWLGYAEVVDRHVLRGRKTIMGFDSLHIPNIGNCRATEGVDNRLAGVRQDIRIILTLGHFGVKAHRRGAMAPAENARKIFQLEPAPRGVGAREGLRSQEQRGRAVSDL